MECPQHQNSDQKMRIRLSVISAVLTPITLCAIAFILKAMTVGLATQSKLLMTTFWTTWAMALWYASYLIQLRENQATRTKLKKFQDRFLAKLDTLQGAWNKILVKAHSPKGWDLRFKNKGKSKYKHSRNLKSSSTSSHFMEK
jgi:hypothetical protein